MTNTDIAHPRKAAKVVDVNALLAPLIKASTMTSTGIHVFPNGKSGKRFPTSDGRDGIR